MHSQHTTKARAGAGFFVLHASFLSPAPAALKLLQRNRHHGSGHCCLRDVDPTCHDLSCLHLLTAAAAGLVAVMLLLVGYVSHSPC